MLTMWGVMPHAVSSCALYLEQYVGGEVGAFREVTLKRCRGVLLYTARDLAADLDYQFKV